MKLNFPIIVSLQYCELHFNVFPRLITKSYNFLNRWTLSPYLKSLKCLKEYPLTYACTVP